MTELVSSLEKLHRIFGGATVTTQSIAHLTTEQRRATIQYLLDGVDKDTQLEAAKDILAKLDKGHHDILVAHVLYGYDPDPTSPSTGLPQKLRGAVHALVQRYQPNLVVDAAMLELPEKLRQDVARTFLPKKSLREKLDEQRAAKEAEQAELYTLVDTGSGQELGKIKQLSQHLRVIDGKTGEPVDYVQVRVVPEYDFREADDAPPRMLALYRQAGGPTE